MTVPAWYIEADAKIRKGDLLGASQVLAELIPEVGHPPRPRDELIYIAEIYRRIGRPERALRLLHPIVRSKGRARAQARGRSSLATDAEKAEYAGSLNRIGATAESRRLLGEVDAGKAPMRALFEGLAFIHEWNFVQAAKPLKEAYRDPALPNYTRAIAAVNLGQCYFHLGDHAEARDLFRRLIPNLLKKNYVFLLSNALSLDTQNEVFSGNWSAAASRLAEAMALAGKLSAEGSYDDLVLEKAGALVALYRDKSVEPLLRNRTQAYRFGQSEILRDCDLQLSLIRRDSGLLAQVYYHTPFPHYRSRIERLAASNGLKVPEVWCEENPSQEPPIDILEIPNLKPGQSIFRLCDLLLSERYRKFTLANFAVEVFPDAYFNFETTPDQFHQLVKRARGFLDQNGSPFEILKDHSGYSLKANRRIIHRKSNIGDSALIRKLRKTFDTRAFSAVEARVALGMTQQNFSILSRQELEALRLEKTGAGKNTSYRIQAIVTAG